MNIEIVSGSPRQESVTYRLALHLQNYLREKTEHHVDIIDVRNFNLMPMQEQVYTSVDKTPEKYKPLAKRMFEADAFIIVSPEYNGSYTAAMKNLFDHFPKQVHKPFGIVTASPGALGGVRAALQLQQFICALFGIPSPYMLVTPQVDKKFDAEGKLLDPLFENAIHNFVTEYLWLAEHLKPEPVYN
jgi:NAD(P)H-dependent FMN reductase